MQTNGLQRERLWRFWDTKNKRMSYGEYGFDEDGYAVELIHEDDGEFIHEEFNIVNGLIDMDYINQVDIKGNKIYEMDIVFHKCNLGVYIGVIVWIANEYSSKYGIRWLIGSCSVRWNQLEVIGNIYEDDKICKLYWADYYKQEEDEKRKKVIADKEGNGKLLHEVHREKEQHEVHREKRIR
jgi:hypothetical protein